MTVILRMPSDNRLQQSSARGLRKSNLPHPGLAARLYTQPPNSTQLYHPTPHPSLPELQLPRVPYSAFIVQSWALYLGSTKVGATRTCAPRSATGCAPKGRSQVGHFLHCSTTAGRQPLQTRA